ncbi:TPA: hypothetical protein ACX6PX_001455 [Photobacterium damselae]
MQDVDTQKINNVFRLRMVLDRLQGTGYKHIDDDFEEYIMKQEERAHLLAERDAIRNRMSPLEEVFSNKRNPFVEKFTDFINGRIITSVSKTSVMKKGVKNVIGNLSGKSRSFLLEFNEVMGEHNKARGTIKYEFDLIMFKEGRSKIKNEFVLRVNTTSTGHYAIVGFRDEKFYILY